MSSDFILYTRVSRVGKRRNDLLASHDDQIAAIRALAAREGLTLIDDLSYRDEDRSANDFNRANFVRAIDAVRTGNAAGIVVATLDRFSRDVFAGAQMIQRIGEFGGTLYADDAGGEIDLDDDESLIFYIMRGTMATLEHRRKARGLAASVARSIRGGRHLASVYGYTRPEGFQTVTIDGESFKVRYPIEPNPDEAPGVVLAYTLRADGKSWQAIADRLNADYPLPDGNWTYGRVRAMVKSETYLGIAHSGEHRKPNAHEAIVSRNLWDRANRPKPGPTADPDRDPWLLSGVIRCGSCGYRMRPTTTKGRRYYKCKAKHRAGTCAAPVNLPADEAEMHMAETFRDFARGLGNATPHADASVAGLRAAYDRQLEVIRAMSRDYMTRHALPDDVREVVESEWTRANAELADKRDAKERAERDASGIEDWPTEVNVAEEFDNLPATEQRRLIAAAYPVVLARRAVGWREAIASRLRPLRRGAVPADLATERRMRVPRVFFAA